MNGKLRRKQRMGESEKWRNSEIVPRHNRRASIETNKKKTLSLAKPLSSPRRIILQNIHHASLPSVGSWQEAHEKRVKLGRKEMQMELYREIFPYNSISSVLLHDKALRSWRLCEKRFSSLCDARFFITAF